MPPRPPHNAGQGPGPKWNRSLSAGKVDALIDQAAREQWTDFTLRNTDYGEGPQTDALTRRQVRRIGALTHLRRLTLWGFDIGAEGAHALASFYNLTQLDLSYNNIGDEGARALASLSNLTQLFLNFNNIGAEGARALASLSNLTQLYLSNNNIGDEGARAILDAWLNHPKADQFKTLKLRENRDLSKLLPPEALHTDDAQVILAAYRTFQNRHKRPLNQGKLLVLGNEAVGKTSLLNYLIHNKPRNPDEPKTPQARIETTPWSPGANELSLNVWDFGGQEMQRGTHQFFLTHRSLYLLVIEDRREDGEPALQEWLRIIRTRSGGSPVIIAINKSDDPANPGFRDFDEALLQREHGIVAVVRTSCNNNEYSRKSIAALKRLIAETIANDPRLKHIRDPIPVPWLRVKTRVTNLAREQSVLDLQTYTQLCLTAAGEGEDRITDPNEQRALLQVLHYSGIVVAHGLEPDSNATQREITLLDPNWLTTAIYTLLTHHVILQQEGELRRQQLPRLLDAKTYPAHRHEFIIDMMKHSSLGLCFELPNSDSQTWLIPEALRPNSPDYTHWPKDSLLFRYEYATLPRAVLPRFIVQAHRSLTKERTIWRTGAVLEPVPGCQALVRADRDKRRIDIAIAGPASHRREALAVVIHHLEAVHSHYADLGEKAVVPLPEQPELAVAYDHLLQVEAEDGPNYTWRPEGANRKYSVKELLNGVRLDRHADGRLLLERARAGEIATPMRLNRRKAPQSKPKAQQAKSKRPRVFLSYAWENKAYRNKVKSLATRLRRDGIDVRLDDWHNDGLDIPTFMDCETRHADFVLILCSPAYRGKVNAMQDGQKITGVGWEHQLFTSSIWSAEKDLRTFIVSLFDGEAGEAIPTFLAGLPRVDLRPEEGSFEDQYKELLRRLLNRTEQPPPLGKPPRNLTPKPVKPLRGPAPQSAKGKGPAKGKRP